MIKSISLVPYLHFNGNCEEALNLYARLLDGKAEVHERYDNPAMNAPDDYKNKALHASLQFGESVILASDVFPGSSFSRGSGDTALSITLNDAEKAKKIFAQLAEGGEVMVPFDKQFWGAWHGNLRDKYGVRWMVNAE